MNRNRYLFYFVMSLALAVVIAWGALRDVPPIPKLFAEQDKLEHFLTFAALTLWVSALVKPSRLFLAISLCLAAALGLESAQGVFSQARSASVFDFLASSIGVFSAAGFIWTARYFLRRRRVAGLE